MELRFRNFIVAGLLLFVTIAQAQGTFSIGLLKYNGGGDWYANPTSLPNLIEFANKNIGTSIAPEAVTIDASNPEIFNLNLNINYNAKVQRPSDVQASIQHIVISCRLNHANKQATLAKRDILTKS